MNHRRTLLIVLAAVVLAVVDGADAAAADCKMVQMADMPVRVERNKLIIDGAIDGKPVGIMLDTGSSLTVMSRPAAARLGLVTHRIRGYRLFGIGGEMEVEASEIDEFTLGHATRKGWRMLVAGDRDLGVDIAVILGEDFLHLVDIEFDLAHDAVRLYQPKDCAGAALAYWAPGGADTVEMDAIYDASPQIVVPVEINGKPLRAILDSGAGISVLDKGDAARLGVAPGTPGVVPIGSGGGLGRKLVDYWMATFKTFAIGNEITQDPPIPFGDLWRDTTYVEKGTLVPQKVQGNAAMLLGADFLRAHRVLVSHSQRKIYFTYVGGPVFDATRRLQPRKEPVPEKTGEPAPGGK